MANNQNGPDPVKPIPDSTVARIAGNIAAGLVTQKEYSNAEVAEISVHIARLIVAEIERTHGPH